MRAKSSKNDQSRGLYKEMEDANTVVVTVAAHLEVQVDDVCESYDLTMAQHNITPETVIKAKKQYKKRDQIEDEDD
jgi:hypothetical protein